ncbi:MAG: DUF433 domain-containing protein [Phormidesmis sp.]
MQAAIDIGTLVVTTPGVCGDRPRIAGTRVTVQNIATDFNAGTKPEDIVAKKPQLTQAQVYATNRGGSGNKAGLSFSFRESLLWSF